ncbi:MAG: hypothetical protein V8Q30_10945 [Acutalibacteraceae bacterium]
MSRRRASFCSTSTPDSTVRAMAALVPVSSRRSSSTAGAFSRITCSRY